MGEPDLRRQFVDVHTCVELAQGGRDLAPAGRADLAPKSLDRVERLIRVRLDGDDREPGRLEQHLRHGVGAMPAREHYPRRRRHVTAQR